MLLKLRITNVYDDGQEIVTNEVLEVDPPLDADDVEEWAWDHIWPHTGTGRTDGDAAYFATVTDSDDPAWVGREFEFGT